jgi:hypothetical protein
MPATPATLGDSVTASPLIVSRGMDKGAILMNTSSGDCFELNGVGALAWDLIGRGLALEAIVGEIVKAYRIDEATARSDLRRLVDELAQQGIVRVIPR